MAGDAPEHLRHGRPVVLAVDDELGARESFTVILEDDYEVLTAPSGRIALDILRSRRVDAVLLDIRMPGPDGLDVLARIKEIDPGLEVILVSAVSDIPTVVKGIRLGALDYLSKPFDEAILRDKVLAAIRRRTGPSPVLLVGSNPAILAAFATLLAPYASVTTAEPLVAALPDPARCRPLLVLYHSDGAPQAAARFVQLVGERLQGCPLILLPPFPCGVKEVDGRAGIAPDCIMDQPYRFDDILARVATLAPALERLSLDAARLGSHVVMMVEYIVRSYRQSLDASTIARAVGLSVDRLSHVVRERLGVALMDYVNRFRLEVARHLISTTDLCLEEVADRSGFSSASHLSRAFVQYTGIRPGQYRSHGENGR